MNFKYDSIEHKCLCCNINYQQKLDETVKERVFNMHKCSDRETNKFIALLRKGVYSYEYIDSV